MDFDLGFLQFGFFSGLKGKCEVDFGVERAKRVNDVDGIR